MLSLIMHGKFSMIKSMKIKWRQLYNTAQLQYVRNQSFQCDKFTEFYFSIDIKENIPHRRRRHTLIQAHVAYLCSQNDLLLPFDKID